MKEKWWVTCGWKEIGIFVTQENAEAAALPYFRVGEAVMRRVTIGGFAVYWLAPAE